MFFYDKNFYLDETKIFDPNEKFNRIQFVLELFDNIAFPHSLSLSRDVNSSLGIVGMGLCILLSLIHI